MTHSSCEAELLSVTTGACFGESFVYVAKELAQRQPSLELWNDNQAAVSVFNDQGGSWRTRALKIRANYLKDRLSLRLCELFHIPGVENIADVGTKFLGSVRLKELRRLIGLWMCETTHPAPAGDSITQKLRAIVMACCLCVSTAQSERSETNGSEPKFVAVGMVVITLVLAVCGIVMWMRRGCARGCVMRETLRETTARIERTVLLPGLSLHTVTM